MGDGRRGKKERRSTEETLHASDHPRLIRRLNDQPPAFYLLAAIVTASLIIALVLWLDDRALALVACVAFAGLSGWWIRSVWRQWSDAALTERIIGVAGCLMLLGSVAANLVRFLAV